MGTRSMVKPAKESTKEQKALAHKIKMGAKKIVRERMYNRFSHNEYVEANLGVNHPDYGMSEKEHMIAKRERGEI